MVGCCIDRIINCLVFPGGLVTGYILRLKRTNRGSVVLTEGRSKDIILGDERVKPKVTAFT